MSVDLWCISGKKCPVHGRGHIPISPIFFVSVVGSGLCCSGSFPCSRNCSFCLVEWTNFKIAAVGSHMIFLCFCVGVAGDAIGSHSPDHRSASISSSDSCSVVLSGKRESPFSSIGRVGSCWVAVLFSS